MSDWWPHPSKPRPVDGGIKARSKRGAIARMWWSERFIEVLESLGVGGRLDRGRTYARKGQVINLALDPGAVTASVQGSRARPYRVRIRLTAFGKAEWATVCDTLAGEMPEDIEGVFTSVGLSLFPARADELTMDCTCPDWEVPCKHLAAVFYQLAESFDDDPFGILAWRGRDRDELLDILAALRTGSVAADHADRAEAATPLAELVDSYFTWQAEPMRHAPVETTPDAVLDQVPSVEVTVRGMPLIDVLRPTYQDRLPIHTA